MTEEYGRSYFYGASKSNYINYEQMNHSKVFGGITHFVRSHGIKGERLQNSLPCPDNLFDCITAVDVLEHTKDFEKNFGKLS